MHQYQLGQEIREFTEQIMTTSSLPLCLLVPVGSDSPVSLHRRDPPAGHPQHCTTCQRVRKRVCVWFFFMRCPTGSGSQMGKSEHYKSMSNSLPSFSSYYCWEWPRACHFTSNAPMVPETVYTEQHPLIVCSIELNSKQTAVVKQAHWSTFPNNTFFS